MKLSFVITLSMAVSTIHLIDAKALLVKPLQRSTSSPSNRNNENLQQQLLSDTCKTILVEINNPEEAIKLIRHIQPLKEQCKTVICKAPNCLSKLLTWCPFIDHVVLQDNDRPYDIKIDLEDLTHIVHAHALDEYKPYLIVDNSLLAVWQEAFAIDTNFKVGVSFESIYSSSHHGNTSLNIESFIPLARMQQVSLYSLDDITPTTIPEHVDIHHFDTQIQRSLPDIAAIMHHLDLIITSQPIIMYLASALGKNVWFVASDRIQNDHDIKTYYRDIPLFNNTSDKEILFDIMYELTQTIKQPKAYIVTAEIQLGELIDKMTILEIKAERINDAKKLDNVWKELYSLQKTFDECVTVTPALTTLIHELKAANEALWTTEDLIRNKEREKSFDNEFILLARSVYIQNDERCRLKREINELLGSRLIEEKSYKPYN